MSDWRRAVVLTHRWLGIGIGLILFGWFSSGIVMMYARMPELPGAERLARRAPLDLAGARLTPADALRQQQIADPQRLLVTMLLGRPVYRALAVSGQWATVFADTGERLGPLSPAAAIAEARVFAPEHAATVQYERRITEPDQWTLELRSALPLHVLSLGDSAGSVLYIAERTGEVVLRTTAPERRVAYAGAVLHWLYFTPFRRHSMLWARSVMWLAAAGCVLCLLGLTWGVSISKRSPYRGWMRWHHYAGLIFGTVSLTWTFSGLLSLDPLDWHADTTPTPAQRHALSGGSLRLNEFTLDELRRHTQDARVRQVEVIPFRGRLRLIVDGRAPETIGDDELLAAAIAAMRGSAPLDVTRLESYDAYYYDRTRTQPLPVLRVRFRDASGTWLYLDPNRGVIVHKEEKSSRLNRWLYHGLHSLDFPFLYARRPLWDFVVIFLILGGMMSAVTAAVPAWRRLRRHAHRLL